MVHGAIGVGEHREGNFELFRVLDSPFQSISQNYKHIRAGCLKILVHAPQLGDVRAALHSVVFAHEEKHDPRLAAGIGRSRFAAFAGEKSEFGRVRANRYFIAHASIPCSILPMRQ